MPDRWTPTRLSDCLADAFPGEWGADGGERHNAVVLRATDIDDDGNVVGVGAKRWISRSKLPQKALRKGDILLEASGGGPNKPVGRVARFLSGSETHVASNFFRTLRPHHGVDSGFLVHRLIKLHQDPVIWSMQQQTTGIINLKVSEYLEHVLLLPPKEEQVCIAEFLDTLDDAIRSTEQLIAKLENVKRGLLHDLLTRGIDDNGEIRDPERHPEQFKDSEIGRIPAAWEVARLGNLLIDGPRNGMYKPASEIGSGRLIVGQVAFNPRDRVDYSAARRARVTPSEHAVYGLRDGDLLVTRVFAVVTGVGRSILVDQPPEDAVYESNMMRLRVGSRVLPSWVFFAMKQPTARHHIESHANASNQTSINQGNRSPTQAASAS